MTFLELIDESLKNRNAKILQQRMGVEGEACTLEDVGSSFDVSRERIRQIEKAAIKKLSNRIKFWELVESNLKEYIEIQSRPLAVELVGKVEPRLSEISGRKVPISYVLGKIHPCGLYVVETKSGSVICTISQEEWEDRIGEAHLIMKQAAKQDWTVEQIDLMMDGLLVEKGQEMREELWQSVEEYAFILGEGAERHIVSYGRGAESVVRAVLEASERPLHFSDIKRCSEEWFNRRIDVRRAHNAAAEVGYQFSRGTYGLLKHLPLSKDDARAIADYVEDLIDSEAVGRQWHSRELIEPLENECLVDIDRFSVYELSICLKKYSGLKYLGRQVWTSSESSKKGQEKRIDIRQAAISLLEEEGMPMSARELKRKIGELRGLVSSQTQLHPKGRLILVGRGKYGLIDRDLGVSGSERKAIEQALLDEMEVRQEALHVTEIQDCLINRGVKALPLEDFSGYLHFARFSDDMAIGAGQYIYKSDWEGPRRLSLKDAAKKVLCEHKAGIDNGELVRKVELELNRSVDEVSVISAATNAGAEKEGAGPRWTIAEDRC